MFIYSLISALGVSALSLSGILILGMNKKRLDYILFLLVSFSAGALLGSAFFHLLPEAIEENDALFVFGMLMVGFVVFYLLERLLRWRHCHEFDCDNHKVLGYQNLVGDGVHNFLDGLIIVSAFSVDVSLGIAVTLSVVLHEVPQEIGDFGVLLYSGFSKSKAIVFNLLSALFAVGGVVMGYFAISQIEPVIQYLLPLAAGGFIYIAASDLIPELHKEKSASKSLNSFAIFLVALVFMFALKVIE